MPSVRFQEGCHPSFVRRELSSIFRGVPSGFLLLLRLYGGLTRLHSWPSYIALSFTIPLFSNYTLIVVWLSYFKTKAFTCCHIFRCITFSHLTRGKTSRQHRSYCEAPNYRFPSHCGPPFEGSIIQNDMIIVYGWQSGWTPEVLNGGFWAVWL